MDSLIHAVLQATLISKFVLVLLLVMSIASWTYMCGKWLTLRAAQRRAHEGLSAFDKAGELKRALPIVAADERSPLYGITRRAVREYNRITRTRRHGTPAQRQRSPRPAFRHCRGNCETQVVPGPAGHCGQHRSFYRSLRHGMGHYAFFTAIAKMKSVSLATVAPGIAEALIATAVGLFVAIPAVCGYNMFRAKLTGIEGVCINYAGQLLNRLQHEAAEHGDGISFAGKD